MDHEMTVQGGGGKARRSDVNADFAAAKAALVDWFITDAVHLTNPRVLVQQVCTRLVAAGVPLHQFSAFVTTLHPDYFGVVHRWSRESGEVRTTQGSHEMFGTAQVQKSPVRTVIADGAAALRRRLDAPGFVADFPVLEDYRDAGATDYVVMRMDFSDGSAHAISMSSDRPGGYTTAELTLVNDLLPYMARLTEIQSLRYLATTLLDTYVGHDTGHRILVGNIRRGSGETIHAVIWFCDLRGFTGLSDRLPRDELIDLLNAYFDCVGEPVRTRRGEILKFIGDAMLAIFPVPDPGDVPAACGRAFAAAQEALKRREEINAQRNKDRQPPIDFAIAIHVGDVMYGNIGTGDRLDFTVIGPAVNIATRIEGLNRDLGQNILVSAEFAKSYQGPLKSLGKHRLKGVGELQKIFGPADGG